MLNSNSETYMKMKSIFKILCAGLCLTTASCSNFLDEKPQSDFTQEGTGTEDLVSKYNSIADAQSELQGAYESFKEDIFQMENYTIGDIQTDNCYLGGDGVAEEQFDALKLTSSNYKVEMIWSQYYAMAGAATTVIENTKMMADDASTEAERNRIIAEAKFIRAWAYFDIVRLWGDAPMITELIPTITSENIEKWYPIMYPERTESDKIYDQILADLDDTTIACLTSKSQGAFQATKGAAYALKAKVLATRGDISSRDYTQVAALCDKVIGEGYSLLDNFDDLWQPDNKFTSEGIFEVYYTSDSPNWAYWVLLKEDDGSVTWRRYCTPTHDLVAKFDKDNDTRYASSIVWKEVPYDTYWPADNYPLSYKVREKTNNIILIRLADILLLKAEALVELNRTAEAIRIVNTIRTRAGLSEALLDENMNQSSGRLAVENERQLELYMEGQRWFDLIRNNRLIEVMSKHKDKNGRLLYSSLEEFRQLWPIPQDEKDKNSNLTQNEGY
jgi:hypothetical protein